MGRVVNIGGLPVLIEAEGPARQRAVASLLDGLAARSDAPVLSLRYVGEAPPLPDRDPDRSFDDLLLWREGDELVLYDGTGLRARVAGGSAWLGGEAADLSVAFRRLFHPVISHLLVSEGSYVLHAAAVAFGNFAFVVVGPTGSGKSTLGLAALQTGWQLLADDMVVIRGDGPLEVAGIARRAMVPADVGIDGIGRGGIEVGDPAPEDPRGRCLLANEALTPGWFQVGGVISVAHSPAPDGHLRDVSAQQSLYRVLASQAGTGHPPFLRKFFPVAAGLARLPAWELGLGCGADGRLPAAGRLLEKVANSVRPEGDPRYQPHGLSIPECR